MKIRVFCTLKPVIPPSKPKSAIDRLQGKIERQKTMKRILSALFICSSIAFLPAAGSPQPGGKLLSEKELFTELSSPPQNNIERANKLAQLFKEAGITSITTQQVRLPRAPLTEPVNINIIATMPGQTSNTIVISSHTDCSPEGKGVIDDWSGVCMLVNLAKTFKDTKPVHTLVFLGTTLEEKGLIGSRFYARSMSSNDISRTKAMIELECLGISKTKVWQTGSADELEALAADIARQNNIPIKLRQLVGVNADSDAFSARNIPAITFDSLEESDFPLIDSPRDSFESINKENYAEQYKFLVSFIRAVDAHAAKFSPANRERISAAARASVMFVPDAGEIARSGTVVVGEVFKDGPEEKAGLAKGDKITMFGGSKIDTINDLAGRVRVLKAGEKVKIQVQRGKETVDLSIQY